MKELKFTIDQDDGQVLSAYLRLKEGKVHRTVELTEGECYVDEDCHGQPLGVEMLCPGTLEHCARRVMRKYKSRGMLRAVRQVRQQFSGC